MSDMKLMMRLLGNNAGLVDTLNRSDNRVRGFVSTVKKEFAGLKRTLTSVQGQLAGIGITIGAVQQVMASARLDKGLIQIRQTAGASVNETRGLRSEFFGMAKETGKQVEGLKEGYDSLIQSGLNLKESRETIKGINVAMAVTSAQAQTLAEALTVGATAYNYDLSKPGQALLILDKMTVAGRLGNAELESLSMIFGRVGVNAASAGMSFDKTLAFIEGLSMIERQPERLATLADSTIRLFTNANYMKQAMKGTGVKFFDAQGARRDAVDVLRDIKAKYDRLKTDQARSVFIQKAFGKADLDTIKGMRTLLSGDLLNKISGNFSTDIQNAGGTLKRDLPDAINNAVDQVGRLKASLREAADSFIQPLNEGINKGIQKLLNDKSKDGMGLSGGQLIAGGLGLGVAALLTARLGKGLLSNLLKSGGSVATGIAAGKAVEYAAGVTPVFVVNWPGSSMAMAVPGGGGLDKILDKAVKNFGWLGLGGNVAAVGAAGAAGYGLGWLINQGAGKIAGMASGGRYADEGWLGQLLFDLLHNPPKNEINIDTRIDGNGRTTTTVNGMNTQVKSTSNRGSFRG